MDATSRGNRRQLADLVAIVAGVAGIGFAIWGAPLHGASTSSAVSNIGYVWISYFLAGAFALAGVGLAQRSPKLGKILVALGGIIMLSSVAFFRFPDAWAWGSILVLGLLLLGSAPLVGRMPPANPPSR
jgi:hypothetical protein